MNPVYIKGKNINNIINLSKLWGKGHSFGDIETWELYMKLGTLLCQRKYPRNILPGLSVI